MSDDFQEEDIDDFKVEVAKAPVEPSVVERLAAVEDEETAERVRDADKKIEQHRRDKQQGILRINASFRPRKAADHIVINLEVPKE